MGAEREAGRVKLERVIVREISLPLVHFFETSFGRIHGRRVLLVEVRADGLSGWGECVADDAPGFSYETVDTVWPVLSRFLVPRMLGVRFSRADEFPGRVRSVRGHPMAKAGLEAALWDLQAKAAGMPLWKLLGGRHRRIPCGVSIGIQDHPDILLGKIEQELEAGYRRIKIKIKPGWDLDVVAAVRKRFPRISLMVDANSAYGRKDFDHLAELDRFDLLMMEQPLEYDDVFRHVELQARLRTPICLDESIRHRRDADHAIAVGACRIVNIKMGRVGGHTEARAVHDVCRAGGVPVWCGGMLVTGIGRAHNVALSTLENFTLPGDVSASRRYFHRDTARPPIEVDSDGTITPSLEPGIGYEPDLEWIDRITVRSETWSGAVERRRPRRRSGNGAF